MNIVRFIDVSKRCLVTFPAVELTSYRYLALSYVWGRPNPSRQVLELNSQSQEELEKPDSLNNHTTPQTMTDTIDLAAALDVPYVWIDRICIQQDSISDKSEQISKMHAIYNAAFVTIIAASGADVHHGLPGIGPATRHQEQEEILVVPPCQRKCSPSTEHDCDGLSLLTTVSPAIREYHYLASTTWDQRGWTMQERVLSRRSLIFTSEQMYFACAEATFFEETFCELSFPRFQYFTRRQAELNLNSTVRTYSEQHDPTERIWDIFTLLVNRFSQRLLSFPGDGFDAFAAILESLRSQQKEEFVWGIPLSQFELGLSWTTFDGQYRRRDRTTLPMTNQRRQVIFPSWSWMGWVGEAHISVGRNRLDSEEPTVECFVHRASDRAGRDIELLKLKTYAHQQTSKQPLSAPSWKSHKSREVTLPRLRHEIPALTQQVLSEIPDFHMLFFFTEIAQLAVRPSPPESSVSKLKFPSLSFVCSNCSTVSQHLTGSPTPSIPDSVAQRFPHLLQHDESGQAPLGDNIPDILHPSGSGIKVGSLTRMARQHWESGNYDTGLQNFIVVGRRHIEELGDEFPATLLIMQVEKSSTAVKERNSGDESKQAIDGIWERVCMGEIEESAWEAARPQWRLIALL